MRARSRKRVKERERETLLRCKPTEIYWLLCTRKAARIECGHAYNHRGTPPRRRRGAKKCLWFIVENVLIEFTLLVRRSIPKGFDLVFSMREKKTDAIDERRLINVTRSAIYTSEQRFFCPLYLSAKKFVLFFCFISASIRSFYTAVNRLLVNC